jgi:uncharacterized membrane protein
LTIAVSMTFLPAAALADTFQTGGETFQYTTLSDPGMQNTVALSINNLGEITGYAYDSGGDFGFTYDAGVFSPQSQYAMPGFDSTDIYGVNNAGTLVGSYYNQSDPSVANALVVAGGVEQLHDAPQSEYYGINNNGGIVGSTYTGSGASLTATGFFRSGSNSTPISYPNALTYAHGVNDSDDIVGFYETPSGVYGAFETTPGCVIATCFQTLGLPGAHSSFAYGINDSGVIVGASVDTSRVGQGFIFNGSTYTVIDIPGAVDTYVTGINDQGQIVGWYQESNGTLQAFEASQVPEPTLSGWQAAILLLILAGIGRRQILRNRRQAA